MRAIRSERTERGEDRVGGVHDRRPAEHAHGLQVVGGARHQVTGVVRVEERRRLALEVGEEIVAQIELDVAAHRHQSACAAGS